MKGKIYKIQNTINSKVYIGQTTQTLKKRFSGHCCYSKTDRSVNMYIKRAIHKYGRENFSIELLEECPIEQMSEREKFWISYYDSYNSGYNLTLGGQDSNYFSLNRLENTIDIKKFIEYIKEFRPLAKEVARHFNISKCSVYNLIQRLGDLNSDVDYVVKLGESNSNSGQPHNALQIANDEKTKNRNLMINLDKGLMYNSNADDKGTLYLLPYSELQRFVDAKRAKDPNYGFTVRTIGDKVIRHSNQF